VVPVDPRLPSSLVPARVGAQFLIDTEDVDLDAACTACTQFVRHALAPDPAEPLKE
jgi:hypothetical protein